MLPCSMGADDIYQLKSLVGSGCRTHGPPHWVARFSLSGREREQFLASVRSTTQRNAVVTTLRVVQRKVPVHPKRLKRPLAGMIIDIAHCLRQGIRRNRCSRLLSL